MLSPTSKYDLADGVYNNKHIAGHKVYVAVTEDSIAIFPLTAAGQAWRADSAASFNVPASLSCNTTAHPAAMQLSKWSFDVDVLTIPFKYRPSIARFPNQLNTSFNGALYIGYRKDLYRLHYKHMPLGDYRRIQRHYGYSFGVFNGIGATPMNIWVTNGGIATEYDGFISLHGISAIVAIQDFSFGLGLGADILLDQNRHVWIYQGKPWLGAVVTLNLN